MNIIKADIRRQVKSLLIWALTLALIDLLFMSFFPSMKSSGMGALFKAKMAMIPAQMRDSLGLSSLVDFSDLLQYFAYCWQYLLLAVCIYAGMAGASTLIREESEGTIEFLYAEPVSRTKIAVSKLASSFILQLALNLVLFVVNLLLLIVLREKGYSFMSGLIKISLSSFYACTAFWAVGFAASAIIRRVSQASPFALGFFFVTYIIGMLSSIAKKQAFLKYLSPYHYVLPSDILRVGSMKAAYAVVLALLILAATATGIVVYRKKDMRI
jgi:ABC-2 type transport system permease protein